MALLLRPGHRRHADELLRPALRPDRAGAARAVLDRRPRHPQDAIRALVELAARSLGVAAEGELRDYFRLPVAGFKQAVAELVEDKVLLPVTVQGWKPPA